MTILYHYCQTSTFFSIASNKSIWLSSLTQSNDSKEGKLVSEIIGQLAKQDNLNELSTGQIRGAVEFLEDHFDGLGFCLSEEGDLLSQWRGYASDASGFAIGFSSEYLDSLSKYNETNVDLRFNIEKVEYDLTRQEELVKPTYLEVKKITDSGQLKFPFRGGLLDNRSDEDIKKQESEFKTANLSLFMRIYALMPKIYAMKINAFREEREWRLISHTERKQNDSCSYKLSGDRIVPYKELKLSELHLDPIQEIIVGPKNQTPVDVIESFLRKHGINNVTVKRSSATYR